MVQKKGFAEGFPEKLAAPALRALSAAGYSSLSQLSQITEAELAALHGMGPNAISRIKAAMKEKGLTFKKA